MRFASGVTVHAAASWYGTGTVGGAANSIVAARRHGEARTRRGNAGSDPIALKWPSRNRKRFDFRQPMLVLRAYSFVLTTALSPS
jgi:hypothetical protein